MKSRPKLKPQLDISISVLLLILHLSCGLSSVTQKLMNSTELNSIEQHPCGLTSPGCDLPQVPGLRVESEVRPLVEDVISRRMRRSPSRQRKRHRLLLKSGLASGDFTKPQNGSRKGRRHRKNLILKSDDDGHIITSASEVRRHWCRTVPFSLNITSPRCRSREVKNNFCYGQCNSFFIPQQSTSKGVAFQSYSNCKPDHIRWTNVTLDCPGQNPPNVTKTVLFVESCRCIATEDNHHLRHHRHRNARRG